MKISPLRLSLCAPLLSLVMGSAPVWAQQPGEWVPQGIEALGQHASARTDFSLDKSMLQFAQKFDNSDPDTQHVVAGLDAIAVHSYHFSEPGLYDPAVLDSIRHQYHSAGWQHMVSAHNKGDGTGSTELWIHFHGANVTNMTVLLASPTQLNFIAIDGSLRPLDLLHLSGHFGIPKFHDDTYVPAPDDRR